MDRAEYAERRRRVLEAIAPGALLVGAAPIAYRNHDVEQEYRQDSDFYYLTGFEEPGSALLLLPGAEAPFVMFVRPRDPEREVWDGTRLGVEGAVSEIGADVAHPIGELRTQLVELLRNVPNLYFQLGGIAGLDADVLESLARLRGRVRQGATWPTAIIEPGTVLHEMRLRKEASEVAALRQAAEITCAGHREAMAAARPGRNEYEVEAVLRASFGQRGARRMSYPPIVASGINATVLHYRQNDREMRDGELLLIDAGAEYRYYAGDVTRTFPVGGCFSRVQARVYDLVLAGQLAAIDAARPGATLDDVHQAALRVLVEGLIQLGVIAGPIEAALAEERYRPYFMHRTSHFLGMDVHDVGSAYRGGAPRPLEQGMVITVEPGLYFGAGGDAAPDDYRGLGVRIEDDVLITATGREVLTASVPKVREEVELACRG